MSRWEDKCRVILEGEEGLVNQTKADIGEGEVAENKRLLGE